MSLAPRESTWNSKSIPSLYLLRRPFVFTGCLIRRQSQGSELGPQRRAGDPQDASGLRLVAARVPQDLAQQMPIGERLPLGIEVGRIGIQAVVDKVRPIE